MAGWDSRREGVFVDGAGGNAGEGSAGTSASRFGVSVVDVAEEVEVGAGPDPAVRFSLVGEPASAEGMVGEDDDELAGGVGVEEGFGEGRFAKAELAASMSPAARRGGGEADDADGGGFAGW
ncbi:MAG: hypothetical protein U0359_13730 [Byssovorax sp.]